MAGEHNRQRVCLSCHVSGIILFSIGWKKIKNKTTTARVEDETEYNGGEFIDTKRPRIIFDDFVFVLVFVQQGGLLRPVCTTSESSLENKKAVNYR